MSTTLKRRVIVVLESSCAVLDSIPVYRRGCGWRASCWGCYPLGLARKAAELDERWGTKVWHA